MYVREGGEVMKTVVNRIMALFLVLTMVTAGLPQSALTVTAAERETDTQGYAEQQNDTAIKALESKETTEEYSSETSSKKDNFAKEESTEKQSSEKESFEEEFSEEKSFEEKSFVTQESTEDDSIKDDLTKEQPSDEQTSDEASSTEILSTEESSVMEETSTKQQETEESSIMTETETEEIKQQESAVGIKKKGTGYNNPNVTWILYEDGKLVVEGTGDFVGTNLLGPTAPWCDVYNSSTNCSADIKTAEIKVNGMKSFAGMFDCCRNLQSVDFSGCDMSTVTDMSYMFNQCSSLTGRNRKCNSWNWIYV